MSLVYRAVKGSPLTIAEGDGNIQYLYDLIIALEDSPPTAVSISSITQAGDQITIHLTDSTTQGPFTLPTGLPNYVGDWQPLTLYAVNDWFTENGALYAVIFAHTSAASFDPGANDGLGHDYYQLLFSQPSNVLPTGGDTGQVLKKIDSTNYNTFWDDETFSPPAVVEISDTLFTPAALADGNRYYRCTHASGCFVTLPLNADVPFAVGTELHFRQCGINPVVFDEGSSGSPTINGIDGFHDETARQGAVVTCKKVNTDEWDLFGLLSEGS